MQIFKLRRDENATIAPSVVLARRAHGYWVFGAIHMHPH